ncbi:hypothetical protein F5146DRAFT_1037283 [Armillaria mellea]|nr:hypothetical protein F5146DRAFT_1037283 [Armillaria mellea]
MARRTNNSLSTNPRQTHRIRNIKRRKRASAPAGKSVKAEPKEEQTETAKLLHSPSPPKDFGWENPAELDYLDASTWTKDDIVRHLITNSFSVPSRVPHPKWATITMADGSTTVIPNAYRIPLMFVGEFLLCEAFLKDAKRAMGEEGMGIAWRSPVFDRALARYRMRWLLSEPSYLEEFWEMYGEDEYRKNAIRFDWKRLALKGQEGFKLDEEQIESGITATSCCHEASEYLKAWQRTRAWGQLPTLDPEFSLVRTKTDFDLPNQRPRSPAPVNNIGNEVSVSMAFPIPFSKGDFLQISYLKCQSQELPANFPGLSDPDCSTSFWRDPLATLLYTEACEEEDRAVKSEPDVEEIRVSNALMLDALLEDTASAPIKSLRKLRRAAS